MIVDYLLKLHDGQWTLKNYRIIKQYKNKIL